MVSTRAVKAVAVTVVVAAGAMLAGVPQASAAGVSLQPEVSPYALFYQDSTGVMKGFEPEYGQINANGPMAPGSAPSTAPTPGNFQMVWQGTNHHLWSSGPTGPIDLGLQFGSSAGPNQVTVNTSPSLATFPDGKWIAAISGTGGALSTAGSWGNQSTTMTLAPDTSPSVAATPGNDSSTDLYADKTYNPDEYTFAWQGTDNHLWVWTPPAAAIDTGAAMAAGTSPSVTMWGGYLGINHNYLVAFHGSDGHLWLYDWISSAFATSDPVMAAGANPSTRQLVNGSLPIAYQAGNGDLYVDGGGGDTGLPMMANTNPSVFVAPLDEPGEPLGGQAAYTGYVSSTGAVSLYGDDYTNNTTFSLSTGQIAPAGVSPAGVSAVNWADQGNIVTDEIGFAPFQPPPGPATAATATGRTAVAPRLASRPAGTLTVAQPAIAGSCPTVRAHLTQYAARGIKRVACQTITSAPPPMFVRTATPAPARAGSPSATPSATVSSLCASTNNTWIVSRSEECIQNEQSNWVIYEVPSGVETGTVQFLLNQDIITQTNSTLPVENDSISYNAATGSAAGEPVTIMFAAGCGTPCSVASGGGTTFTATLGGGQGNIHTVYSDSPGTSAADTFGINYTFGFAIPGATITPASYSPPNKIRCDNMFPGNMGAGCAVAGLVPILTLPVSTYGAAAVNVAIGEQYLPGNPGLPSGTPLTRGDPANTNANRAAICAGFRALTAVANDSCDEYPFAATQQSGGALGVTGSNCLEVLPVQLPNGWAPQFLNRYTGKQLCSRGHVDSGLNSAVGTALISFFTTNRMLIGDPFVVQIVN